MLWIFFFSVGSSNSSHSNPRDQSHRDERLETHLEAEQSEDEDEFIDNDFKGKICWKICVNTLVQITPFFYFSGNSRRLSGHGKRHMGLQITHVWNTDFVPQYFCILFLVIYVTYFHHDYE